jgi:hypothetical protein
MVGAGHIYRCAVQVVSPMDMQTIGMLFGSSAVLTIVSFWLHARLAGTGERVGPLSMAAFVFGWLCVLTALLTGAFLLTMAVTR